MLEETKPNHVSVTTRVEYGDEILTPEALTFIQTLHERFEGRRKELLKARETRQQPIDNGHLPDFLPETKAIRDGDWTIGDIPHDLKDRRVEITGPASDPKMVINALNSGAKVFMADFEDAMSPHFDNAVQGQINLKQANQKTLNLTGANGKAYTLNDNTAVLLVRPRGWHLEEHHCLVGGEVVSGSLFDFGLYVFHNVRQLLNQNTAPYFYLPKLESYMEAELWDDVFTLAEDYFNLQRGTFKATVLIETLFAAFQADEILYALKDHIVGLNCGRWDYIFSYLKAFHQQKDFLLPDRSQITMTVPFMRAYSLYVIKVCHRRHASAIGGMAAQIPVKNDPETHQAAIQKVIQDKTREVQDGHDGSWVAHPGLVQPVKDVFDQNMPEPNQIERQREDIHVTADDMIEIPEGIITEAGLRTNISVGIQYIEHWLHGQGAVPINHLMEDAATAEISRGQIWQWVHHPDACLPDGTEITQDLIRQLTDEEMKKIEQNIGDERYQNGRLTEARQLFEQLIETETFINFLTLPGYHYLKNEE
ncbi:malate synthase A [Tuberibacillus sp. Marseille-P3662]|uniref:malate synthase A n=1 Tax=Tuberibacillus sp. Marseille-P3662 TaxID=1965358 RepID=UPI000A1C95B7|nr:malate synthase A [Tuberibacillus sp. Marseille-P3662]